MTIDAPRSIPDPDPLSRIGDNTKAQNRRVSELERGAPQRSMSISDDTGRGIRVDETGFRTVDAEGNTVGIFQTSDGTFVIKDGAGTPMARFGELLSDPGNFGGEIWDEVNSVWVKLVTGASTSWAAVTGKPSTFAPSAHTHAGSDVTSAVDEATHADGVTSSAFARNIAGIPGTYIAMWMHSNGQIGYNTSDERYKKNIRDFSLTREQFMALRARIYDRKATDADDYTPAVSVDELGLIAHETAEAVPELAIKRDGELDGVFYERLAVATLPIVQEQQRQIEDQDRQLNEQAARLAALEAAVTAMGGTL